MTLQLEGLRFARDTFRLGPIDLALPAMKRSVLLGPSGCGKTTLLRLIAGLEVPDGGTIRYRDRIFAGPTWLPPQRRRVAMLFQGLALWPHMSARKQVRFTGRCSDEQADGWLEHVGLGDKGDRLPGQLSGGEGGRVALARALAQRPDLLLLDEPLRSIDPHLRLDLQRLIRQLTSDTELTTIIVTHDREEALAMGEHIVLMHEGRVVETGTADDLLHRPRRAFTASFLRGAALLPLVRKGERLHGALGEFAVPETMNGSGEVFLAVTPDDLAPSEGGAYAAPLLDLVHVPRGLLGEVEIDGVRLQIPLSEPRAPGTTVRFELRRDPPIVSGDR